MNKKQAEAQQELMAKRQRQLQGIIAHAAKKAGMDKPALQEVARLNPELKKEIPQEKFFILPTGERIRHFKNKSKLINLFNFHIYNLFNRGHQ